MRQAMVISFERVLLLSGLLLLAVLPLLWFMKVKRQAVARPPPVEMEM